MHIISFEGILLQHSQTCASTYVDTQEHIFIDYCVFYHRVRLHEPNF